MARNFTSSPIPFVSMAIVSVAVLAFNYDRPANTPTERPAPALAAEWTHFGLGDWLIRTSDTKTAANGAKAAVEALSGCNVVEVLVSPAETFVMASTDCDS